MTDRSIDSVLSEGEQEEEEQGNALPRDEGGRCTDKRAAPRLFLSGDDEVDHGDDEDEDDDGDDNDGGGFDFEYTGELEMMMTAEDSSEVALGKDEESDWRGGRYYPESSIEREKVLDRINSLGSSGDDDYDDGVSPPPAVVTVDLSNERLCFGRASPPHDRYGNDVAFGMDLIGALRRHTRSAAGRKRVAAGRKRVAGRDETIWGRRAIRHLRVGSVFFGYFRLWNRLQHALTRCISNLPDLRTLDLYEDDDRASDAGSISFQIHEVLPLLDSMSHARDLRLEGLDVFHRDDIRRLAGCFPPDSKNNNDGDRWRDLKSLVIHNIWILHHPNGNMADRVVNVDPIFSAMGGRRNLPNLETFRLVQRWPPNEGAGDMVVDMPFQVSDCAFARFLENGTSLKHLELTGFLFDPEHYRLMADRLSGHRNIETLRLSALDLFDGKRETGVWRTSRIGSVPSRGEEEDRVREAARLLIRLAAAAPALRMIRVGFPFRTSLDRLLLPSVREIEARTAMNRNGLERIRCRGGDPPSSCGPSRYGEQRERVEFLVRLRDLGGDEFVRSRFSNSGAIVDLVSLDALFLSLSMLPDVCIASESTV